MQANALRAGSQARLCAADSLQSGREGRPAQGGGDVSFHFFFGHRTASVFFSLFLFGTSLLRRPPWSLSLSLSLSLAHSHNHTTHQRQKNEQLLRPARERRWPHHQRGHKHLPGSARCVALVFFHFLCFSRRERRRRARPRTEAKTYLYPPPPPFSTSLSLSFQATQTPRGSGPRLRSRPGSQ